MGEIADMVLDGMLDEETGKVIDGEAPGYPRRLSEMTQKAQKSNAGKSRRRRLRRQRQRAARRAAAASA